MHFYALTYLSGMLYITKHIIKCENKSISTQEKADNTKREVTIRLFKTEKEGRDGKVLTCRTRRRRRIVNMSPGLREKDKKIEKRKQPNQHIPTV